MASNTGARSVQQARKDVQDWATQKIRKRERDTQVTLIRSKLRLEAKKRVLEAERKNRYIIKENLDYYLEILEKNYNKKTPEEYFQRKTAEEITAEGIKLEKLFRKILARILVIAENGYKRIENIYEKSGRQDATKFLAKKGKIILGKEYLMNNINVIKAKIQLEFRTIFRYCKFLENKGKLPRWNPFSSIDKLNKIKLIDWIATVEKKEMNLLREADKIINKVF